MINLIKAKAALVAVFLCLSFKSAAETSITFGGIGFHSGDHEYPNNFHRTTIVTHKKYFAGYFKNSFNDDTFVAGYTAVDEMDMMDASLRLGMSYGYRKSGGCYKIQRKPRSSDPKRYCPVIAPEFTFKRLPLMPTIVLFGKSVTLNFKWTFDE